jgi:hypothetical protein
MERPPLALEGPLSSLGKTRDDTNTPKEHDGIAPQNEKNEAEAASIVFKPGYRFYIAFTALAVLAMMVALDGTAVSVALPVRILLSFISLSNSQLIAVVDYSHGFKWHHYRSFLVRHRLLAQLGHLSAPPWRTV